MKVLIIEDDLEISTYIKNSLVEDSFTVDTAKNASNGSFMARTNFYDAIIVDYALPDSDGILLCSELRESGVETPIIFLTNNKEMRKRIIALEKGADDYMTKPFAIEELRARLLALARRPKHVEDPILIIDDLVLDTNRRTVRRGSTQIYLTRKTYNLLEYLMRNKDTVLSRGVIMEYVWNSEGDPFSNTVEAHILSLRKKINIAGKKNLLRNIPGRGYIMDGY
jgi:DNA-binding response OmpR family regulator